MNKIKIIVMSVVVVAAVTVAAAINQGLLAQRAYAQNAQTVADLEAAIAATEKKIQMINDRDEIANLIRVYGYYLDKNLWNNLADLFAREGSIELAQRGAYVGQDRVREFLFTAFGKEGPRPGAVSNHMNLQPVIHVAEDGMTAKSRHRLLMQMGRNGNGGTWGGGVYENEYVKEDGVWKFKKVHAYNTFMAAYDGGWAHASSNRFPPRNEKFPPDLEPTAIFSAFPDIYDPPFHYDNPVTGRHEEPRGLITQPENTATP